MIKSIKLLFFSLFIIFTFAIGCSDEKESIVVPQPNSFKVTISNVSKVFNFSSSGVFNTPTGETQPGPLVPGGKYEFEFSAAPGSKLSFATMFVPSNDFFYAPEETGLDLFDASGSQITGDITSMVKLWDAGTEANQEPGLGVDQPQRQSGANTGDVDSDNTVRLAVDSFNNLPLVSNVIKVTLTSTSSTGFKLSIENISTENTLSTSDGNTQAIPLAPGTWVVHSENAPLFQSGQAAALSSLESLAEDGDPSDLFSTLSSETGLTGILAPGAWAVYTDGNPIFTSGQVNLGNGLESLSEDGDPSGLAAALTNAANVKSSGAFNTPTGASQPGALLPGNSYEFTVSAVPGEILSFATMFVQSNDLFYSPNSSGLSLFDGSGQPISGDVTNQIKLWDAGTEVNEKPGVGLNQAPRQPGTNTGADENGIVQEVNDGFSYPTVNEVIQVTITK